MTEQMERWVVFVNGLPVARWEGRLRYEDLPDKAKEHGVMPSEDYETVDKN